MQKVLVFKSQESASEYLAITFAAKIAKNNSLNKKTILGFATGVTPLLMYKHLIALKKGTFTTQTNFLNNQSVDLRNPVSWENVITFNLDEFVGVTKDHSELFFNYMQTHLFKDLNLQPQNIHFPDGNASDIKLSAQNYEDEITKNGNIELQLISLGINGHMAYNEPGTPLDSWTHEATLSPETRRNLVAQKKFDSLEATPTSALTVGVKTILEKMNEVIMVSFGKTKAEMTKLMIEGPVNSQITASALQNHKNCIFILDKDAAIKLNGKNIELIHMD